LINFLLVPFSPVGFFELGKKSQFWIGDVFAVGKAVAVVVDC